MINLGKATVKVEILNSLPGIDKVATRFNFDASAYSYQLLLNSPFFCPLLVDHVAEEDETFAACFPAKRKKYIHNYMSASDFTPPQDEEYVLFTAISKVDGIFKDIVEKGNFNKYDLVQPYNYQNVPPSYIGPKWSNSTQSGMSVPNDQLAISFANAWLKGKVTADEFKKKWENAKSLVEAGEVEKSYNYLNQNNVADGLWWAIESEPFLEENTPFWVNLKIADTPPTRDHETCFVISLGIDDKQQSYDIFISLNNKPRITDYYNGRGGDYSTTPPNYKDFDVDLSRVLDSQEDIEVGIMTIAGRLVVYVNKIPLIYSKVDKSSGDSGGTLREAKIAKGKIRICGTNVQAIINVSPMCFAYTSALALPIPTIARDNTKTENIQYQGVTNLGAFSGPVCLIPQQPNKKGRLFGVDCEKFIGDGGSASPEGTGFHKQGIISFATAKSAGITALPSSDFYVLTMSPSSSKWKKGTIENGGAPYFFRLKGGAERPMEVAGGGNEIMPEVITVSQSVTTPDYFHALSTATVEAYNKGGKWDKLRKTQYGIRISWGWNGVYTKTFTGVINGATTSEIAGKETITLECVDYMQVLKDTPIVNSPFYDGMVAYYALADIAKRAGIQSFVKDWESETDYFLPSGYAFSAPKVRYNREQKLFDCMIDMIKKFEAYAHFDADGVLHLTRHPGGLFATGHSVAFAFTTNPTGKPEELILDQKNIEFSVSETVNRLSVMTLDRDTRNTIMYTRSATGDEDNILYRKVKLENQAAWGELEVARVQADREAARIFYPIIKASFATSGFGGSVANIFDFVTVDGQEFKLLTINRKYDANSNDFKNEYSGEWLWGRETA